MIKNIWLAVCLFYMHDCFSQQSFQLAPPTLKYTSAFFSGTTSFEVIFNQPGTEIRYTLNGTEPTEHDLLYSTPVPITKHTVVKVKTFGRDFLPSATVSATFVKDGKTIREIRFSKPNEYYAKSRADILHDNIGGIANYRHGTWLGYDSDTVTIDIALEKEEKINKVLINLLQDENAWIFLPERMVLYYYSTNQKAYLPLGKEALVHEAPSLKKECSLREIIPQQGIKTDKLKLEIWPLKKIPDWHQGKGNHAWLFIDEIKVY